MILFKGKKAKVGPVHTMDITTDHIRRVFFPKDFYEKYSYLGSIPYNEKGELFKALEPLVIFMDYKAKPKFCPRWFLRLLNLFGNDNSIVRVRNRRLHDLFSKLTKGYMIWDYKTKWSNYDLRISISGDKQMNFLSDSIQREFYKQGYRQDLIDQITKLQPDIKIVNTTISSLESLLESLESSAE
jgi:hypothetical protein